MGWGHVCFAHTVILESEQGFALSGHLVFLEGQLLFTSRFRLILTLLFFLLSYIIFLLPSAHWQSYFSSYLIVVIFVVIHTST